MAESAKKATKRSLRKVTVAQDETIARADSFEAKFGWLLLEKETTKNVAEGFIGQTIGSNCRQPSPYRGQELLVGGGGRLAVAREEARKETMQEALAEIIKYEISLNYVKN